MLWLTRCLICNHSLYLLRDGRVKCSKCEKKLSLHKVNKVITLIQCFVENESALSVSKRLHIAYASVQKYYETFRLLAAHICEKEYEQKRSGSCEYEEYLYLESSKKLNRQAIFDAQNFITFDYDNHIYTLLLPSLHRYKQQMIQDNIHTPYIEAFKSFQRENKIVKVSKYFNNIVKFWDYLEHAIRPYKGVNAEKFAYFLKEFEFKYNHTKEDAKDLLTQAYFQGDT